MKCLNNNNKKMKKQYNAYSAHLNCKIYNYNVKKEKKFFQFNNRNENEYEKSKVCTTEYSIWTSL